MSTRAILTALPASVWTIATRLGDPAKTVHEEVINLFYARKVQPKQSGADPDDYETVWIPR